MAIAILGEPPLWAAERSIDVSRPLGVVALLAAVLMACSPTGVGSPSSPVGSIETLPDVLTYKGNAARTAEHPGPGPTSTPASIWRIEHDSLVRAAPLIADGQVVATAEDGTILILDAASGASRTLSVADRFRATGTISGGTLYIAGLDGHLWAIPTSGGDSGWRVDGTHEESFITLAGDLVIAGEPDALVAYARTSGEEAWRLEFSGTERTALGGDVLYASGRESGTLTAVGIDGVERWTFDTGADEVLTPIVAGDTLYIATRGAAGGGSDVTRLDLDGAKLWRAEVDGKIGSHAVDRSRVYVTIQEDPSVLLALDSATGAIIWQHHFDALEVSVLAIAGERVYLVSRAEGLVAVETASGDVAWQVEVGDVARAGLAISGGIAFVTTEDINGRGRVIAFR